MGFRSLLVLALMVALPLGVAASDDEEGLPLLSPGLRVRLVSELVVGRVTGRIVETDTHGLRVLTDRGVAVRVPFEALTRLEASFGQRRHTREGLVAGLAVGLLIGAFGEVDERTCHYDDSTSFCSRGAALAGGISGGTLLGAGIGALVKTDRWQAVSLDRLRVSLEPRIASGRAGARLALSW